MSNNALSNLYVEKAALEHPVAFWTLNEQVDYVSQITEDERQLQLFATWQLENGEAVDEASTSLNPPFTDSAVSRIIGSIPPTQTQDIIARSVFNLSENLVEELSNFAIGFYVYFDSALVNSLSFGYQYTDIETSEVVEVLETFLVRSNYVNSWRFFSNTFDLPPASDVASDVKLLIKFNVSQGGVAGDYDVLINGLSVGQRSEDFNKSSYGVEPEPFSLNVNIPNVFKALPAFPYGASGKNGYYLSQGYKLSAKNFGVPLVYGSSNVTKIFPNTYNNEDYPSLLFPGYGFLNERGRYNDYTVEMWTRVNAKTAMPRKIFGPIIGNDGLYVDDVYLTFKIGNISRSHFIGEWFRPMLIHIRILGGFITVLLNGEEVISIDIDQSTVPLPTEFSESGKEQDWIGFYAYQDVDPIDIDNFSIYSYGMPTEVAKRRFVWGQAVSSPEQTNSSINSVTAFNDYAFANYAANYNYPDFANWKQGFFSNVEAGSKSLSLPEYSLPDFQLGNKTLQNLYEDIKDIVPDESDPDDVAGIPYLTLSPNSEWESEEKFIYFESLALLSEQVDSFYGVFKTDGTEINKPLIKVTNKTNSDNFLISINGNTINYSLTISGVTTSLVSKPVITNEKFAAGLNIPAVSRVQSNTFGRFFSDRSVLDVFVGGDGFAKFSGRIYKVGFDASYNNRKNFQCYDEFGVLCPQIFESITDVSIGTNGQDGRVTYTTSVPHSYSIGDTITISGIVSDPVDVFNLSSQRVIGVTENTFTIESDASGTYTSGGTSTDKATKIYNHTANYTLVPIDKYGIFFADVAVAGYWEDYMPLSYFTKKIIDRDGTSDYELDLIQLNQDYPEPPSSERQQSTSTWTYRDLQIEYSNPVILSYSDLNNEFYTGWANYEEMRNNAVIVNFYNTDSRSMRTYITFQRISEGANRNILDFDNKYKPLVSGLIDPSTIDSEWENTAYEVTNGTIIYPPRVTSTGARVDVEDLAIVYHLDIKSDGIIHHPIRIKEFQLASQVLERTDFTPVGSRFGVPVFYYSKIGLYFDLKGKNPIATYKKSTPYLYLNRQSGWEIKGDFNTLVDRGLAIPINIPTANNIEVSSAQMWVRFSDIEFPADPVMIFSIDHNDGIYDFYLQGDSSLQRGSIFGVDRQSNEILDDIEYYINGQSVNKAFIENEEWAVIGLEFPDLLNFSNRTGRINLNGPLMYNNVSYNLATNIEKNETLETRSWADMLSVHIGGITDVQATGTEVTYTATNDYIIGETVTITGIVPSQFDVINAVVTGASGNTFTIESTATGEYVSGGTVTSGKWEDLQTDLIVADGSIPPYAWQQVKIIEQNIVFSIDPKTVYEKYTGTNRFIVDNNSSGILVKPDAFKAYKEINWSETVKIPA